LKKGKKSHGFVLMQNRSMFYISTFAGQGINFLPSSVWNVIMAILISLALILIIDLFIDPCLLIV